MQTYLSERLPLLGLMVGVLALVVGISTSTLMVAIAVLFCVYLVAAALYIAAVAAFVVRPVSLGWIAFAICAAVAPVLIVPDVASESQTSYGAAQTGATAAFVALLIVYLIVSWRNYGKSHKPCPECANTVYSKARVCHYCGFRWLPPLSEPQSG